MLMVSVAPPIADAQIPSPPDPISLQDRFEQTCPVRPAGVPHNNNYSTTVTSGGGRSSQSRFGRDQYGYPGQQYNSGGYGNGMHEVLPHARHF